MTLPFERRENPYPQWRREKLCLLNMGSTSSLDFKSLCINCLVSLSKFVRKYGKPYSLASRGRVTGGVIE